MLEVLKRLFSPEYLVVSEPGPMGGLWVLYLALGLLFATWLGAALWALLGRKAPDFQSGASNQTVGRDSIPATWAWFELWICLAGLGTVVGRFLGWPGWSARIWPYLLAVLAVTGVLVYLLRTMKLPGWFSAQAHILAFSPIPHAHHPTLPWFLLGLIIHLLGIALIVLGRFSWPIWAAPLILLALFIPQAPLLARRQRPGIMALAPLLGAYAGTLLWLLYQWLGITVIGWQGLVFPNPMVSLFYVDGFILGAVAYALLCQLAVTSTVANRPAILWRGAVIGLLVVTLAWTGIVYFGKRTHGATASDPYAYAQMGVDLAEHGTFLHRLSLFEEVMPLNIAWAPLQPIGYHIPRNDLGDSPSVWATGVSVLFAAGYKLFGEVGLYVTNPIVGLLALAATWALAQELLRGKSKPVRYLTGALAVALLATSPEHVDRLLVPMADATTLLFSMLMLLFALRGMRQLAVKQQSLWSFLLAGIFFAWAYWVRHTQLVLALPAILAIVVGNLQVRRPSSALRPSSIVLPLLAFFGTALVAALPDILYRWRVFGGLLNTETTELHLMALRHIGPVAWQMLRDSLVAGEWGYLFPFAVYGTYRLARERSRQTAVLGSAFLAVLFVHLTYRSLRLRDLISLFPLVDIAVAYGVVVLVQKVQGLTRGKEARLGAALLTVGVIAGVILSLALSRWAMLDNLWKPGWASFGYMRAEQRAAFDRLAELTPPDSVIGASLNAGAVMMYTARDAIRPYDSWTDEEWRIFLDAMQAKRRPVYLLDDGGLMAEFIEQERAQHRLTPIEELQIPLFYTRDRETGWLYRLEWEAP